MKTWKRLLSAALALLVGAAAMGFLTPEWGPSAGAVTQAEIDAMRGSAQNIAQEIESLQEQLSQLQGDKEQALAEKENLDNQIALLNRQIAQQDEIILQYDLLIGDYEGQISEKQEEVEALRAKEEAQYQLFCQRVRAMEEQGSVSYLSILFSSASFSDLLDGVMLIGEIMNYDNQIIAQLQAVRAGVEQAEAELVAQQAQLLSVREQQQGVRNEQEAARAECSARQAAAAELVAEILSQESEYQTALEQMEAEEARVQAEVLRLSRELAAQQQANQTAGLGGYNWPVPSRRITSPFGPRNTGIAGASTDHKGVDIGGVGYTTQVQAAKAGTVIISALSSSYGNYVVLSHGNGNTTLYAHMSSRSVSVGDVVAQGDVLGITGDTGIANGPHLHFEITENGVRVDPLQYLPGYIRAW